MAEDDREKMRAALEQIAFGRKGPTGGHLSRTMMTQLARTALIECGMTWPARKGNEYELRR